MCVCVSVFFAKIFFVFYYFRLYFFWCKLLSPHISPVAWNRRKPPQWGKEKTTRVRWLAFLRWGCCFHGLACRLKMRLSGKGGGRGLATHLAFVGAATRHNSASCMITRYRTLHGPRPAECPGPTIFYRRRDRTREGFHRVGVSCVDAIYVYVVGWSQLRRRPARLFL